MVDQLVASLGSSVVVVFLLACFLFCFVVLFVCLIVPSLCCSRLNGDLCFFIQMERLKVNLSA